MPLEPTRTEKQRRRLVALLEELFQLDQPDLDFGFYKIMHAKAKTVSNFIQKDLLDLVQATFGEMNEAKTEEAREKYEHELEAARAHLDEPENSLAVQEAKAAYETAQAQGTHEGEIYEHLYRFFERYYDNGDFLSRRYFVRESETTAAPYAIPYDGREVLLHWANRDQYYIKTSEHLTQFTFDLARHFDPAPASPFDPEQRALFDSPESLKLHCRIVQATEGEHNNNKANDKTERFFLLHPPQPLVMEAGELVLQFEYRPDPKKSGTAHTWQEKKVEEAEETIFQVLEGMAEAQDYARLLRTELGDEKSKRTLLRKYLNQYTKRNTTDYFIHKNLGSFLKRELDFYIKNEVMRLDDIESASAPRVEDYLAKIKVLRKIAGQLIEFLDQLEAFQKKIWLKKKFVTETHYCFTLDLIPETFYAEIAANEAQCQEWVRLFALDELEGYSEPLRVDFLKTQPFLVLDTAFFSTDFKDALLATVQNLDETLQGLLIHSENFQALGLMQEKYREQVKCIYIDPPYNTSASEILYKNSYKHSSWLSLIQDRYTHGLKLTNEKSISFVAIDYAEIFNLGRYLDDLHNDENRIGLVTVQHNPKGRNQAKFFSENSDYMLVYANNIEKAVFNQFAIDEDVLATFNENDEKGKFRWENFVRARTSWSRTKKPKNWYPLYVSQDLRKITSEKIEGWHEIYPRTSQSDFSWKNIKISFDELNDGEHFKAVEESGEIKIYHKYREQQVLKNVWLQKKYQSEFNGTILLRDIIGSSVFNYPKSVYTVQDIVKLSSDISGNVLDYFAGSGTTGHAVVNLNREDGGNRKYILVEMGDYFETVLKPRMQKVVYSADWKEGKPVSRQGVSQAFKYIRLESYEDALNNLCFQEDAQREALLQANEGFRRGYMLKYWLQFETKGSPSLLNIEQFADPTAYLLKLKKPGSEEYEEKAVDLVETFHWLIGLHVEHLDSWRHYHARFQREPDPELPQDTTTRLILQGRLEESPAGRWGFRKVEGRIGRTPGERNHTERVLIIWRKLTGNLEEDNLMLDEWFQKYRLSPQDSEFDVIYVNGSNNLPNLRQANEHWKVRLIEEAFHQKMWEGNG